MVSANPARSARLLPEMSELEQRRFFSSSMAEVHHGMDNGHDQGHHHRVHDTFIQANLVSNGTIPAAHTDPNLVNPWGIAFNPTAFWWVNDNGTGLSTLYDSAGAKNALEVAVPPAAGSTDHSAPTGIVFSGGGDFVVSENGKSGPSRFLFVTENGTLSGWNPGVDLTHAVLAVDNSAGGAIYKGLALGSVGGNNFLYAADFHNNAIDVFDKGFSPVHTPGAFTDRKLPKDYAPFNIQDLGGNLFVTYAQQDAEKTDEVAGKGKGFIDEFDTSGKLIKRFAEHGPLNAPWGLALAPANFGEFSNDILVGNFGDGRLMAFNQKGDFRGYLRDHDHKPIVIEGLWGIGFGNGNVAGPTNTLFFAAGPNDEADGLFGSLTLSSL
jgi:uncharacterized protein (TIGR03118 family)